MAEETAIPITERRRGRRVPAVAEDVVERIGHIRGTVDLLVPQVQETTRDVAAVKLGLAHQQQISEGVMASVTKTANALTAFQTQLKDVGQYIEESRNRQPARDAKDVADSEALAILVQADQDRRQRETHEKDARRALQRRNRRLLKTAAAGFGLVLAILAPSTVNQFPAGWRPLAYALYAICGVGVVVVGLQLAWHEEPTP